MYNLYEVRIITLFETFNFEVGAKEADEALDCAFEYIHKDLGIVLYNEDLRVAGASEIGTTKSLGMISVGAVLTKEDRT
jgi:hypothetical protein